MFKRKYRVRVMVTFENGDTEWFYSGKVESKYDAQNNMQTLYEKIFNEGFGKLRLTINGTLINMSKVRSITMKVV